jgi:lysophospholipase L1-like esterase
VSLHLDSTEQVFPMGRRCQIAWDWLEPRSVPTFIGPLPQPSFIIEPAPRTEPNVVATQALFAQLARDVTPNVVFFGDSITYNFGYGFGAASWGRTIAPLSAACFGIPGDTAENLLWRIEAGRELVGSPKVAVIEIGINDLVAQGESVPYTVAAIEAVVDAIHALSPATRVELMGLLPAFGPSNPFRAEIEQVNTALARFASASSTGFTDVGPSLTDRATGSIAATFGTDLGHPNALGYQIIAGDIIGVLDGLLGMLPTPTPAPDFLKPSTLRR